MLYFYQKIRLCNQILEEISETLIDFSFLCVRFVIF